MSLTSEQRAAREGKLTASRVGVLMNSGDDLGEGDRPMNEHEATTLPAERAAPAPAITPMEMLQIAVERGTDLDQLQKLMDLQERWEATQARKAYNAALAGFKSDPPRVSKNKHVGYRSQRTNQVTDYDHATLDEVVSKVAPALAQHGLSHAWATSQGAEGITVTCTLTHRDGHAESVKLSGPPDDSGNKNPIQQIGSTVTYLQRYTLLAITGLATEEQDDDGYAAAAPALISAEQKAALIAAIQEVGADTALFLQFLGVPSLDELPAPRHSEAMAALAAKRAKIAKQAREAQGTEPEPEGA